jgi:oxygen-independent coproporphyrinogen III oxidase
VNWPTAQSGYIHVPFCRHRCGYCNFAVVAGRDDLAVPFLDALQGELTQLVRPRPVQTLFIGGGTPTQLACDQLDRLFDLLERWLPLEHGGELTVEANPEDITAAMINQLRRRGVNRLSLGVQSFAAEKLARLQRGHDRDGAVAAIELAASEIGNVSIDLIFAAPGETPQAWQADLQQAVALPISHLSTYALTYEKGTQFWSRRLRGDLHSAGEEDELQMYQDARSIAAEAGLAQYEISSFAKPGQRCRHNQVYWQGRSWHAFGPGAARFVDGRREINHRSPTTYIARLLSGRSPVAQSETITAEQWACERAAFGVRMIDGIDLAQLQRETGVDVAALRRDGIGRCMQHGWLEVSAAHYRLSEAGILMADSVAGELL